MKKIFLELSFTYSMWRKLLLFKVTILLQSGWNTYCVHCTDTTTIYVLLYWKAAEQLFCLYDVAHNFFEGTGVNCSTSFSLTSVLVKHCTVYIQSRSWLFYIVSGAGDIDMAIDSIFLLRNEHFKETVWLDENGLKVVWLDIPW